MPNFLTEPLVPRSVTKPAEDYLTEPQLDQPEWMAQLKGFGAGALEGLRELTSPVNIAGMLPMGRIAGTAGKLAGRAAGAIPEAAAGAEAIQGLSKAIPAGMEAVPQLGKNAMAGPPVVPTNWGAELQGARDFVGRMGGIPNEMAAGRMYTTPPSSLPLPSAAVPAHSLASEAGRISPEAVVGLGAAGAGAAYALPKLKQAWDDISGFGQQVAQPFQQLKGTLDDASRKGLKR